MCDFLTEDIDARPGQLSLLMETVFRGESGFTQICKMLPNVDIFISPPNIRNRPSWYPSYRREVLAAVSIEVDTGPSNLHLLDDFMGVLESDGIHFNILSAINFAKNLADQSLALKARPQDSRKRTEVENHASLQASLLNGLEQRVNVVEAKLENLDARHSEEIDNASNERELHRFIITGTFYII